MLTYFVSENSKEEKKSTDLCENKFSHGIYVANGERRQNCNFTVVQVRCFHFQFYISGNTANSSFQTSRLRVWSLLYISFKSFSDISIPVCFATYCLFLIYIVRPCNSTGSTRLYAAITYTSLDVFFANVSYI